MGRCADPATLLEKLMQRMVRPLTADSHFLPQAPGQA
jgi:hypothetical protein